MQFSAEGKQPLFRPRHSHPTPTTVNDWLLLNLLSAWGKICRSLEIVFEPECFEI